MMRALMLMTLLFGAACGSPPPPRSTASPPKTHSQCSQQPDCAQRGLCSAAGAACVASSSDHCQRSVMCKRSGTCTLRKGRCVVASDADCQRSEVCTTRGMCFYRRGSCASTCAANKGSRVEAVTTFFFRWRAVDDGELAQYWRCVARARHRDLRMARDTLEITDSLSKAFARYPDSQPGHLLKKCVPLLKKAHKKLMFFCPPDGFVKPLAGYRASLLRNREVMQAYARRIEQRSKTVIREKEILALASDFHMAFENRSTKKSLAYWNMLNCVTPELDKNVRKVRKGPDTQYVVEYIYNHCGKKGVDHRPMARKIRETCFNKRHSITNQKDAHYLEALKYLSGDNRDMAALQHCFKKASRAFDQKELEAVARAFIKYREAHGAILKQVQKVKQEMTSP